MGREAHLWPPRACLFIYGPSGRLVGEFKERDLDLADTLMLGWPHNSRTVQLGLTTCSARWPVWTEMALEKIESLIRYDLGFDGYEVAMKRLSVPGSRCSEEFRWSLRVRVR